MGPARFRTVLPFLVLAAILSSSAMVFLLAPDELRRAHGLALLGAIAVFVAWFRYRDDVSVLRVLPAFALIFFVFYRGWAFRQLWIGEPTYDYHLLYADQGFGLQPSLLTYSIVERFGLFPVISAVYESLCLCLGLCYATQIGPGRRAGRAFALLLLPGILGPLCYKLLPACGPVWLLGSACYTGKMPAACASVGLHQLTRIPLDGTWPRNAMPSMHLAWALLMWWTTLETRFVRWISLAFVFGTAIATLGGGEHYLVDLVAAFPFSLAVWSSCMGDVPLHHPRRMLPLAGGCAVLLVWIACIRFAPQLFWISSLVTWIASICVMAGTLLVLSLYWPVARNHEATVAALLKINVRQPV